VGAHQSHNAGAAIATMQCWRPGAFGFAEISEGVSSSSWPGRLQRLSSGKFVEALPGGWELWLDGGHNPAAGAVLAEAVGSWSRVPLVLICAMQVNKDLEGFLRPLLKRADRLIAIDLPNTIEAYKPAEIAAVAEAAGLESRTARSAADAVLTAVKGPRGRILVCGSLYLAGQFLATTSSTD
ncbi:MAG: bifunctional folylpolyglutamate synthase/dihydrofolate synthase, partial [Pseudomonadota bacterium]|nr:bifunctional folylpolyglutamate synthase/dihydrofolate synthase [Pseudomonadota bacterium]